MNASQRILVVAAVAAVAACNDDDGNVAVPTAGYVYDPVYGYDTLSADDGYYDAAMVSGAYGGGLITYAAATLNDLPVAVRLLLARWNASVDDPACLEVTSTGDADRDGIDANSTLTLNCTSTTPSRTATITGTITVQDLDDGAPDAGYTLTFNQLAVRVSGSATLSRTITGTSTYQKVAGSSPLQYSLVRVTTVNGTDLYPDAITRSGTLVMNASGTFTPQIVPGSPITQGTLTLGGRGTFTGADGAVVTIIRQTNPSLHWNNGCVTQGAIQSFDAGAITYQSSRSAQVDVVYNSCTSVSVTRTTVPPATPQ